MISGFDFQQLRDDISRWWERARVPVWQWAMVFSFLALIAALVCLVYWLILHDAHAAGVTAYNPAKPHLSLASAGGGGAGPPVIALTPDPVAGHEVDWVTAIYRAIRVGLSSKNWILLIAAIGIVLLQLLKHFAAPKVPFLRTDRGGVCLAMGAGFFTALAAAAATRAFSIQIVIEAVYYGVLYAGGYASVKKLLAPTPADRAQLAEAAGAVAGEVATATAGGSAQAAAAAVNAILGATEGSPSPLDRPAHGAPPDHGGEGETK